MTAREKLKMRYEAYSIRRNSGLWVIFSHTLGRMIGGGDTESKAWQDALHNMERK